MPVKQPETRRILKVGIDAARSEEKVCRTASSPSLPWPRLFDHSAPGRPMTHRADHVLADPELGNGVGVKKIPLFSGESPDASTASNAFLSQPYRRGKV